MKIELNNYQEQIKEWPNAGYHIMAQYDENKIIVYQSYRPEIGEFAAKNQFFGGAFSLDRMTWIKPNFLWMMYRNGWGTKEGQEITLAIHLKRSAFEHYLEECEYSSFNMSTLENHEEWKTRIATNASRLQWDPDHDPYGAKLERKAIQIGIRNELVRSYVKDDILEIEDISSFVKTQLEFVNKRELHKLEVPFEKPLLFDNQKLNKKLKLI